VVHVLSIDSKRYGAIFSRTDPLPTSDLLAGCVCFQCGSDQLKLTNSVVNRGLHTEDGFARHDVWLAKCQCCGARERVLPCEALPGKTHSAGNIFGALKDLSAGMSKSEVARVHDSSRQNVLKWHNGFHARVLDLASLHRHRAIVAGPDEEGAHLLARFSAFTCEAARRDGQGMKSPLPVLDQSPEGVVGAVVGYLDHLGGPQAAAELGASVFHQAVLLFRGGGIDTSSVIPGPNNMCHSSAHEDETKSRPAQNRTMALRSNRRSDGPFAHAQRTSANSQAQEQGPSMLAIWQNRSGIPGDAVPLVQGLPCAKARGPPAQGA